MGFHAYLVGGFVRDLILRNENLDVDVVIEGDGIRFAEEMSKRLDVKIRVHKEFGTAKILYRDGFKMDVATARLEYYKAPAALPIVEHSSLKLDLYRRDFTINTLAISLNKNTFGELIDFFGAQMDIKEKTIRVLHSLSFVEDPTRVFRAVRFEQRFGFQIGKFTMNLIKNAVKMSFLSRIKGVRIWRELSLILMEENPAGVLLRLQELDLLGSSTRPFCSTGIRSAFSARWIRSSSGTDCSTRGSIRPRLLLSPRSRRPHGPRRRGGPFQEGLPPPRRCAASWPRRLPG